MDWTASGRKDTFSFEMVDPFDLDSSRGTLDGVVEGSCSLTWSYYSEAISSGSIELDNSNYIENSLIRVYHTAELNGETETREVGTFFTSRSDMTYKYGRWSGSLELIGMNQRYIDDLLTYDQAVNAGTSATTYFKNVVSEAGGEASVSSSVTDKTFNTAHVFEFGDTNLSRLNYCADYLDAIVGCDAHGRITLNPYQLPSDREVAYTVPVGSQSVTKVGVVKSDDTDEVINCVGLKYEPTEEDGETLFSTARLTSDHFAAYENVGRHKVTTEVVSDLDPVTQATLDALAAKKLDANASASKKIEVEFCSYLPFEIGDVVRVDYSDGSDTFSFDGMVQQIDAELIPGMPQTVIFDLVRSYDG